MAKKSLILCDTNIIIDLLRNKSKTIDAIKKIGNENIAISAVTYAELIYGARNKTDLNKIIKYLEYIRVIPINDDITDIFLNIVKKYSLSHSIGIPDAIIAATAIYYDLELFTFNIKDFKFIPDLKLYK